MTELRTARRYDLSLPVIIRVPAEHVADSQEGKTRDISTRGLYFVIEQDLEAGSELDLTLTLPAEITHGTEVFVRALGKVVRVERRMEDGTARMGVAAVIERYDIIRGEAARAKRTASRKISTKRVVGSAEIASRQRRGQGSGANPIMTSAQGPVGASEVQLLVNELVLGG